jgi:hypothetical protein
VTQQSVIGSIRWLQTSQCSWSQAFGSILKRLESYSPPSYGVITLCPPSTGYHLPAPVLSNVFWTISLGRSPSGTKVISASRAGILLCMNSSSLNRLRSSPLSSFISYLSDQWLYGLPHDSFVCPSANALPPVVVPHLNLVLPRRLSSSRAPSCYPTRRAGPDLSFPRRREASSAIAREEDWAPASAGVTEAAIFVQSLVLGRPPAPPG